MTLLKRICRRLNIEIQENQGWLIASSVVSGLLYALSCVPIHKEIVSAMPAEYLTIEASWICMSSVVVGTLWKGKIRKTALRNFTVIALVESLLSFSLAMYLVFVAYNVWVFAIAVTLYSSVICFFVGKCKMMFEANLWKAREREQYDNTASIVSNLTAIAGFGVATLLMPSLMTAVVIWGIGCIFDDIGWIIVYIKCRDAIIAGGDLK